MHINWVETSKRTFWRIMDYAFTPIPEGEEHRVQVCYDGSDIPDDNTRRNRSTTATKTNQGNINITRTQHRP